MSHYFQFNVTFPVIELSHIRTHQGKKETKHLIVCHKTLKKEIYVSPLTQFTQFVTKGFVRTLKKYTILISNEDIKYWILHRLVDNKLVQSAGNHFAFYLFRHFVHPEKPPFQ